MILCYMMHHVTAVTCLLLFKKQNKNQRNKIKSKKIDKRKIKNKKIKELDGVPKYKLSILYKR